MITVKKLKGFISSFVALCFIIGASSCNTFVLNNNSSNNNSSDNNSANIESEDNSEDNNVIALNSYNGKTIDLCLDGLRQYLELSSEEAQANFLYQNKYNGFDEQSPVFSWGDDGSENYTVYFSDNSEFRDAVTLVSKDEQMTDVGFFVPGKTYYWKVEGDSGFSNTDVFSTKDMPIRIIEAEGANNVRDIGGWKTQDGRTVKYGMIYRGGQLNGYAGMDSMTDNGKYVFNEILNIKSELDLRRPGKDDGGQSECWWNSEALYKKVSLSQFSCIIPEFEESASGIAKYISSSPQAIKEIFEFLGNENNYPIYFHCNAGADRTGTLAFLINGLLGVSYEDLTRDFETTSFTYYGARWRSSIVNGQFTSDGVMRDDNTNFIAWAEMYSLFMKYYAGDNGTLSSAIENYLINVCKVEQSCIDSIKELMIQQ